MDRDGLCKLFPRDSHKPVSASSQVGDKVILVPGVLASEAKVLTSSNRLLPRAETSTQ